MHEYLSGQITLLNVILINCIKSYSFYSIYIQKKYKFPLLLEKESIVLIKSLHYPSNFLNKMKEKRKISFKKPEILINVNRIKIPVYNLLAIKQADIGSSG